MDLLSPHFGTIFWSLLVFTLLFILLAKFAWKPIMGAIKSREESITNSLNEAKKAREEMSNLSAQNEKLLAEARKERDEILKEARAAADKMVNDAKDEAVKEGKRLLEKARQEITAEKMAALTEIKNQVGLLSLQVAEKLLRKQMADGGEQKAYVEKVVNELHLN